MRRLWPVVLFAAAACGLEFSEPVVDTPAFLQVSVTLTDSLPAGEGRLSGRLWPGYDADGHGRTLTDSSFRIMDRTISPYAGYSTDSPSDIGYADTWEFNPDAPLGSVEVQAPAIPGVEEAAPLLRLTPPWRVGPANVTVAPDSVLRLELSTATEPGDTLHESWRLDVVKDERSVAQMSVSNVVPPTIEVPWAMLAGVAGGGEVRLTVFRGVTTPAAGRRYSAGLFLTIKHVWFVTVQP
jgi:hypothetical protein